MRMTVISNRAELIAYYIRRGYVDTGRTCPFPVETASHLPWWCWKSRSAKGRA
jgi:hypothetical protein